MAKRKIERPKLEDYDNWMMRQDAEVEAVAREIGKSAPSSKQPMVPRKVLEELMKVQSRYAKERAEIEIMARLMQKAAESLEKLIERGIPLEPGCPKFSIVLVDGAKRVVFA